MRELVVDQAAQPVMNVTNNPRGVNSRPLPYGTQTFTAAVPVTNAPDGATTALRVAYPAGSINNPGAIFVSSESMIAGNRYWCQADIFVESGETAGFAFALHGQVSQISTDPGENPVKVVGGWVRMTWLSPAAHHAERPVGLRITSKPGATAGSYLVTNILITPATAPISTKMADGDSPGWRWLGEPGVSESVGYLWTLDPKIIRQKIRNEIARPVVAETTNAQLPGARTTRWFGPSGSTGIHSVVTETTPWGPRFLRKTFTVVGGGNQDTGFDVSILAHAGGSQFETGRPVVPGETFTFVSYIRPSSAGKLGEVGWYRWTDTGVPLTRIRLGQVDLVQGQWNLVASTYTVPADGTKKISLAADIRGGTQWLPGDTLDIAFVGLYSGEQPYIAMHGNTPGWSWLGTPFDSISEGYPYTLESIAGKPRVFLPSTGAQAISNPAPNAQGRALYAIVDIHNLEVGWQFAAIVGNVGADGFGIDTNTENSIRMRGDYPGGNLNLNMGATNTRTVGRHVVCASLDAGMTAQRLMVDNSTDITKPITAPGNPNFNSVTIATRHSTSGVAGIYYEESHDEQTRRKIMAWLARQYGAPVPTGY